MTTSFGPERWAIEITKLLNLVLGPEHFPIDVIRVAHEYTAQRFASDAITMVKGESLPGFDGALYRAPAGRTGWGIVYNNAITSPGRINFTLAHEFGHYLLHRAYHPNAFAVASRTLSDGIRRTPRSSTKQTCLLPLF
jgi:IrrE N-terminal-like domain